MSRHCCCAKPMPMQHMQSCGFGGGYGSGCCNFSTLIILILILLFFGRGFDRRRSGPCGEEREGFGGFGGLFGGIIFIITLFYLSCCGPGKCAGGFGGLY